MWQDNDSAYCHRSLFNFYFLCIFLTLQPLPLFLSFVYVFAILFSLMLSITFNAFPLLPFTANDFMTE